MYQYFVWRYILLINPFAYIHSYCFRFHFSWYRICLVPHSSVTTFFPFRPRRAIFVVAYFDVCLLVSLYIRYFIWSVLSLFVRLSVWLLSYAVYMKKGEVRLLYNFVWIFLGRLFVAGNSLKLKRTYVFYSWNSCYIKNIRKRTFNEPFISEHMVLL